MVSRTWYSSSACCPQLTWLREWANEVNEADENCARRDGDGGDDAHGDDFDESYWHRMTWCRPCLISVSLAHAHAGQLN